MRRFSSYGPINTDLHYYAPRETLIKGVHSQLTGETTNECGHYITVWAPRQCGKTWVMQKPSEKSGNPGNTPVVYLQWSGVRR